MQTRRGADPGWLRTTEGRSSRRGSNATLSMTLHHRPSPGYRPSDRDQDARTQNRDDDRVDQPAAPKAERGHDPSTDNGPDDAEDDVHERAVARSAHDLARRPTGDQADHDPPDDIHAFS